LFNSCKEELRISLSPDEQIRIVPTEYNNILKDSLTITDSDKINHILDSYLNNNYREIRKFFPQYYLKILHNDSILCQYAVSNHMIRDVDGRTYHMKKSFNEYIRLMQHQKTEWD
jgi:hypothetical protein